MDRPGKLMCLTKAERETIRKIYNGPGISEPVIRRLAPRLALAHTVGLLFDAEPPPLTVDPFTLWNSAGQRLRWFIRREGERVTCPELGTRSPRAAA